MATLDDIFNLLKSQGEKIDDLEKKVAAVQEVRAIEVPNVPVDSYGFPILPRPARPPALRPYVAPEPLRPLAELARGPATKN